MSDEFNNPGTDMNDRTGWPDANTGADSQPQNTETGYRSGMQSQEAGNGYRSGMQSQEAGNGYRNGMQSQEAGNGYQSGMQNTGAGAQQAYSQPQPMPQNGANGTAAKAKKKNTPGIVFMKILVAILILGIVVVGASLVIRSSMIDDGRANEETNAFDAVVAFIKGEDAENVKKSAKNDKNVKDDKESKGDRIASGNDSNSSDSGKNNATGKTGSTDVIVDANSADNTQTGTGTAGSDDGNDTLTGDDTGNGTQTGDDGTAAADGYHVITTLGQYKGLEVDYTGTEVTDEEVEEMINEFVQENAVRSKKKKGKVELYSELNFSCTGVVDGVQYDGCTIDEMDIMVGEGAMISGFEEGMIGHSVGETFELPLTFPEDYYEELAGKDVVFTITINWLYKYKNVELTDELVAEKTDCSTVDEYREYVRKSLQDDYENMAEDDIYYQLAELLVNNCEFGGDIDKAVNDDYEYYLQYYDEICQANMGMDAASYYQMYYGYSEEEYKSLVYEESEFSVKYNYALAEIIKAENITLTEDERQQAFEEIFFDNYGFESEEEVYEVATEAEIYNYVDAPLLNAKAEKIIRDSAVVRGK